MATQRVIPVWKADRKQRRYPSDFRVKVAVLEQNKPRLIHARVHDLSLGGMNLLLPEPVGDNALAAIGVRTETGIFWFRSQLVHRKGFRYGFRFLQTDSAQRQILKQLCQSVSA